MCIITALPHVSGLCETKHRKLWIHCITADRNDLGDEALNYRHFHFTRLFVDSARQQMTDDSSCTLVMKLGVSGPLKSDDTYFLTPMFVRGVNVITAAKVFSTSINELLSQLTWLYSLQSERNKVSRALKNLGLNAKKEPHGFRLPMPPFRGIWIAHHHHHHHHHIIIIISSYYRHYTTWWALVSSLIRDCCVGFVTTYVFRGGVVSPTPNPEPGGTGYYFCLGQQLWSVWHGRPYL